MIRFHFFSLEADLPLSYYKDIGKVIAAHAMLESAVSEVVFELLKIDHPAGRTAYQYRAASTQFTLVRALLKLRGITSAINIVDLGEQISDCCKARDQLAHGLWIKSKGQIRLRLTEGTYMTPEGRRSRTTLPEALSVSDGYFDGMRDLILETVAIVQDLKSEIIAALAAEAAQSKPALA